MSHNDTLIPPTIPMDTDAEIENFREIASHFQPSPGDLPELEGVEVAGATIPFNGVIGGDHIIYIDFKKRYDLDRRIERAREQEDQKKLDNLLKCSHRAGIVVADVSGHRFTDALVTVMLHQALLLGTLYELDYRGEITVRLFENLNGRFYKTSSVSRFVTLLYGEISDEGRFRFVSAAHPLPLVFSRLYDEFVPISEDSFITFPPIGTMPSRSDIDLKGEPSVLGYKDRYAVNEINLMGSGDIMLLFTDGLSELESDGSPYLPDRLEQRLREIKDRSAAEICEEIKKDVLALGPHDDVSFVVIKRS